MAGSDIDADEPEAVQPPEETSAAQGRSSEKENDRTHRVGVWLERVIFALVMISFVVGIWAAADPRTPSCDANWQPDSNGPSILLIAGVLPALVGVVAYFARLGLPRRRTISLRFAGLALLLLVTLEFIGFVVWSFSNGMYCLG